MKQYILFLILIFFSLQSVAQERAEYDGVAALVEIKEGWLIVRLPGFEKKIAALDSLLENPSLSGKARNNLVKELAETLKDREIIHTWYPALFDTIYTFSKVAFIYTHESVRFQAGEIPARSAKGEPIDSVYLQNYFFATLHGSVGDSFRFTSKDHRLLSYPFRNNISKPGAIAYPIASFLFPPIWAGSFVGALVIEDSAQHRAYKHVLRVERKLNRMYNRFFVNASSNQGSSE